MSAYVSDVAEIGRLVRGDTRAPLVLYCNGPHCGKSKRLVEELRKSGYSNIRRYQLGIPFWRAAGGVCEVELDGLRHILAKDATAVVIDVRKPPTSGKGRRRAPVTFPGAWSSTPRIRGK